MCIWLVFSCREAGTDNVQSSSVPASRTNPVRNILTLRWSGTSSGLVSSSASLNELRKWFMIAAKFYGGCSNALPAAVAPVTKTFMMSALWAGWAVATVEAAPHENHVLHADLAGHLQLGDRFAQRPQQAFYLAKEGSAADE